MSYVTMQVESKSAQVSQSELFPPPVRLIIITVLFLIAFGIRLYRIENDAVDFHPTRQYRSAIIARGFYFEGLTSVPEWRRNVASINKQREGMYEPPILELLASFAYTIIGKEQMWIARLLSSIFWLIGGGFLYHLIKRLISNDAAILCTGFYLLTPFGIQASRSFQPDPLMVMGFIISISAIARYYDRKSSVRFFVAIAVGALAIFIKFVTLFPILGAFVFAGIYTEGFRRFISSRRCILFGLLSCLPAVVFYSYGLIVNKPFSAAASVHIMPHILIQPFFWKDWVETVLSVVTLPTMLGAVVGVLLLQDRFARGLLIGLWSGYFVFGVFFSYTISTHNYWSLQIIPIVALSLAPVIALIMNALGELYVTSYSRVAAAGILVLAGLIAAYESRFILVTASNQSMTKIAREIGEIVRHSTQTVFLAHQYGKPLQYYGELSGAYWPRSIIDHRYARSGERQRSIQERLDSIGFKPEYFIITHFTEFNQHHLDLKEFLSQYCPVVAQNKDYVIYGACSL